MSELKTTMNGNRVLKQAAMAFLLILILLPGITVSVTAAQPSASALHPNNDIERLTWSQLQFATSILGIPFGSKISLKALSGQEASASLVHPGQGDGIAPSPRVLQIDITSSFVNYKDIRTRLLFNADNALALQRTRHEATEGDERYKVYRFTHEGVFILRRKPKSGEAGLAVEKWTNVSKRFDPYPKQFTGEHILSDTSALLYLGSIAEFENPGDKIEFNAYFDDKLHVVTIEYEGTERIRADFTAQLHEQPSRHIMSYRPALRLAINAHPLGQRGKSDTLQIAGLQGPVKLLVDKELRVPVEVRGKLGFIGEVALKLNQAVLVNSIH